MTPCEPAVTPTFHLFHKWSRWTQYKWTGAFIPDQGENSGKVFHATKDRQKRECKICGKVQDEAVKYD